jgi:dephospho-CoA kinase
MLRVALTGGIATGKSHVLRLLGARGVPTIDADRLAREVVMPGQLAWHALRERFGTGVCRADGSIDRPRLGATVFADSAARADLESIVHPPIRRALAAWFDARATEASLPVAIADIPLLFETGRAAQFDRVIVTVCRPEIQIARVMDRNGLSEGDARKRLAAQLPINDKVAQADFVVRTEGSFDETERQVDAVWAALRSGA